jgi:hypothetical protein
VNPVNEFFLVFSRFSTEERKEIVIFEQVSTE